MALFALISAGGSPGVTTSALALTLGWPSRVILAECDPSGGDVLAGLFAGHLHADRGLLSLAFDAGRGPDDVTRALWPQLTELDEARERMLLAGLSDPRQVGSLIPVWPALAAMFATLPIDVIADCGRLDTADGPLPVLSQADVVALVLRPTLRQVARSRPRVEMLSQLLGGLDRVVLLLAGDGPYPAKDVSLALGVPVLAALPRDDQTAQVLSDGIGRRRRLDSRPLIRSAVLAGKQLRELAGPSPARKPGKPPWAELTGRAGGGAEQGQPDGPAAGLRGAAGWAPPGRGAAPAPFRAADVVGGP
jgi:hypothetical protein